MPLYGVAQAGGVLTCLIPGDSMTLFAAETLTAPQASVAFNRGESPSGNDQGCTFQILFATAPTSTLAIQGSNLDVDADYVTLFTSTSKQQDGYTDTGRWAFYRAKLLTQSAGGAVTVNVQR